MSYTCSYCKTGLMNTKEQYLTHIHGAKHKKKSFQLQAPDDGIEYDEFKTRKSVKALTHYVEEITDFPSLPLKNGIANGSKPLEYGHIREKFYSNNKPIVVYDENPVPEVLYDDPDEFITADDIFYKENSKIESAKYIISSYLKNQKTAAQALNEIGKAMIWELDFEPVPASNYRFGVAVLIDGIEFTIGEGETKKEAKQNAAAEAINEIRMKLKKNKVEPNISNKNVEVLAPTCSSNDSIADIYEKITLDKSMELEKSSAFKMPKRYAAFIITERFDQHAREGTVVAFGAGSGILNKPDNDFTHPGYALKSFDGLVLTRRSLQCFLYNQILLIFDKKRQSCKGEKIYFEIGKDGFIKFKLGCRLHLFLSHAPYGDCVESLPSDWQEPIRLSAKEVERDRNGTVNPLMFTSYTQNTPLNNPGHIYILKDKSKNQWTSLFNYKVGDKAPTNLTMSSTDKLMSWIHLGIQGAMLSHLISPIYLYSVQFGRNYMHEHVSRALLCRVPLEHLNNNKGPFYDNVKFFDPYFERVSVIRDEKDESHFDNDTRVSFNWYMNPISDLPEIVDTNTGCVHPRSPFRLQEGEEINTCSRLSKVCMLIRLKESVNAAIDYFAMRPAFQRTRFLQGINQAAKYNYNSFKSSAMDYRKLKQCLFHALSDKHYGEWSPNIKASEFNLLDHYDI